MKYSTLYMFLISILFLQNAYADKKKNIPSPFDVIPLNNPVKDNEARFLLKVPNNFSIDKVSYISVGPKLLNIKLGKHKEIKLFPGNQGPELRINVQDWKNGFYRLYVRVQDKKKINHDFKSSYKDFVSFNIDKPKLPPVPDPIKNSTLLGVDSDKDGIRDDVQIWIEQTFRSDTEIKLAMKQIATAMQSELENSSNKELSIPASYEAIKATLCLTYIQHSKNIPTPQGVQQMQTIQAMFNNTKERIEANSKSSEHFHGQTYAIFSKEESCNF